MTNSLLAAFQSPLLGWLTIAFFLTATGDTYARRIYPGNTRGQLPAETPYYPVWLGLFAWINIPLKIALVVMNWQFGLLVYVMGFALARLGVLERMGSILLRPFIRTVMPPNVWAMGSADYFSTPEVQRIALRSEKTLYIFSCC